MVVAHATQPARSQRAAGQVVPVLVRNNNVDQALRVLKKMQHEGIFGEMQQRKADEKPSARKTWEKTEAVRRNAES